jgi:predicted NUDIX family NTP pyrophosphohydrolase
VAAKRPARLRISAGLLMYRRRADALLEVLLVHPGGPFFKNKDLGAWSIPKGEISREDQDKLAWAKVEFEEELGVPPPCESFDELGSVKQKGGKTVHAWACEGDFIGPARSNTYQCEWPPRSGQWRSFPEVDDAQWFDVETARTKINEAQAAFLDRLLEKLAG